MESIPVISITGEPGTLLASGPSIDGVVSDVFMVDDGSCVIRNSSVGGSVEGIGRILTVKCRWNTGDAPAGASEGRC